MKKNIRNEFYKVTAKQKSTQIQDKRTFIDSGFKMFTFEIKIFQKKIEISFLDESALNFAYFCRKKRPSILHFFLHVICKKKKYQKLLVKITTT